MTDRLRDIVARLLSSVTSRLDYLALYPARVVAQNADGTLELKVDDARVGGLSKVAIRYGIPGVKAEVAANSRVLLGFEGGDPQRPVATLWELTEATLIFNGGTQKVARVDDEVEVTIPAGSFIVEVTGGSGAPALGVSNATPVTVTGKINAGADKVKA
jgi:hypothetical protein